MKGGVNGRRTVCRPERGRRYGKWRMEPHAGRQSQVCGGQTGTSESWRRSTRSTCGHTRTGSGRTELLRRSGKPGYYFRFRSWRPVHGSHGRSNHRRSRACVPGIRGDRARRTFAGGARPPELRCDQASFQGLRGVTARTDRRCRGFADGRRQHCRHRRTHLALRIHS